MDGIADIDGVIDNNRLPQYVVYDPMACILYVITGDPAMTESSLRLRSVYCVAPPQRGNRILLMPHEGVKGAVIDAATTSITFYLADDMVFTIRPKSNGTKQRVQLSGPAVDRPIRLLRMELFLIREFTDGRVVLRGIQNP